jgi:hypothetical protein
MKSCLSIIIVASVFLACLSLPAYASKPYTGSYTLEASSPVDDPSTSSIEARPGMAIAIEASVSGTYSGPISITLPSFNVNLEYELKHNGIIIDTKKDSYPVNSIRVEPGRTYSQTGSKSYTLPSDLAPGDYTLDCTADVSVFGIGRTEHASFPIKVLGGSPSNTPASDPNTFSPANTVNNNTSSSSSNGYIEGVGSSSKTPQDLSGLSLDPIGILKLVLDSLQHII